MRVEAAQQAGERGEGADMANPGDDLLAQKLPPMKPA